MCGLLESRQLGSSSHTHGELHLEAPVFWHTSVFMHLSDPIPDAVWLPGNPMNAALVSLFTQKHLSWPQDGEVRASEQSELAHCLQPSCVLESRQPFSSSHAHRSFLPGHSQPEAAEGQTEAQVCARMRPCMFMPMYVCKHRCCDYRQPVRRPPHIHRSQGIS